MGIGLIGFNPSTVTRSVIIVLTGSLSMYLTVKFSYLAFWTIYIDGDTKVCGTKSLLVNSKTIGWYNRVDKIFHIVILRNFNDVTLTRLISVSSYSNMAMLGQRLFLFLIV